MEIPGVQDFPEEVIMDRSLHLVRWGKGLVRCRAGVQAWPRRLLVVVVGCGTEVGFPSYESQVLEVTLIQQKERFMPCLLGS